MIVVRVLLGVLTTWSTIDAITVPIDRADVQLAPTRPSMISNGWRPLTGYENIGTNVSPSSNLDRNAPLHPVLGKLQEHMHQVASEKLKPQTKNQKPQEYTPPSILGSFSALAHAAAKTRPKPKDYPKQSTGATTHYSFLLPPPRDSYRFEIEPNRKPMLRDNEAFLRQPSFISQGHQSDVNGSPFFSKGSGFTTSTTNPPSFSKNRPFVINGINGFGIQQPIHSMRHNQPQQFEVQKASNTKSYFQPPGLENPQNFVKDVNSQGGNFPRFQNHPHNSQIPNGGAGNFYSQVDHPPPFRSSYERDPSFLVHESHEVSYVTPSSNFGYNFRPSLPYDNLVPPNLFGSTTAPKVEVNKFTPSQSGGIRNDHYKQFELSNNPEDSLIKAQPLSHGLPQAGTYFLQGEQRQPSSWTQQKSKFTTEINEVLPRKNPPGKFRQEASRPNPVFSSQPEVVFIRPNGQPQFENPISSGQVHQTTSSEPEYETPESISLKHFNEQQFLLQQQLVQQDRQRLQEQELQRQQEQQRKQEEEVRKRQEEIRIFELREKEAEQKKLEEEVKQREHQQREQQQREQQQRDEHEQQKLQEEFELHSHQQMQEQIENQRHQEAQEQIEKRKQEQLRQELEERKKLQEQQLAVQQQELNRPIAGQDRSPTQQVFHQLQETFESAVVDQEIKKTVEPAQQETQPQIEPEVRPYRPKFPQRGPSRRRRPLTSGYVAQATESSVQNVNTQQPLTETSVPTTVEPETTTIPVPVTLRPRVRRPGQTVKRRRPFATTPTPQYESSSVREPETSSRHQSPDSIDFSKRRRPRPTQPSVEAEESVTERHYIRKRPSGHRQRVNPGEPFEAEVVTEIVRPTRIIYKDTTQWENYPESFKKKDSQEIDTSSLPSQTLAIGQDMEQVSTENGQVFEFSTATVEPEEVTGFEDQIRTLRPTQSYNTEGNIPLEQLFEKPEENHVEPATTAEDITVADTTTTTTTTTSSTTTTTQVPSTTPEVTSTTRQSHRIRPLKYGNATRPRFSIKDYKSRLDYKNRLSQTSTTEASPVSASPVRRRFTTEKPEDGSTSRYKYMSRVAYKPTTSSPSTSPESVEEDVATDRVNRFMPKRKFNMNLYRSRVTATTTQGAKTAHEDNRQSTTRPENIYSSAIRRPRPSYRNRNQPEVTQTEEATEMTAEETSFYSSMTTPKLKESPERTEEDSGSDDEDKEEATNGKDGGNEVFEKEEAAVVNKIEDEKEAEELTGDSPTRRMQESEKYDDDDDHLVGQSESIPTLPSWTEPSRDAEDALISQRIANLTSSASELHEPGMFKAVSPATESRVINPHFAIATDEPTLPIEAFFQVLAKKDE